MVLIGDAVHAPSNSSGLMQLIMPIMARRLNPEKLAGTEQRYRTDWAETVS